MSRIDDLIAEHCPEGVTFKALGDCAEYSDTKIDASKLDKNNFVGVDNLLQNAAGKTAADHAPNTARLTAYEAGDILLGNIRPYLKKIWLANDRGGCSGDVLAIRIAESYRYDLMPEFLYRLLASDVFFAHNMQHAKGAKMPRGSREAILRYKIPVPPLEVQRAIVEVLDKFSELEARRRQYQHYRDALLTFGELAPNKQTNKRSTTLGEVVNTTNTVRWPDTAGETYQYIDLTSVDRSTHTITETHSINRESAPSRAQQIVRHGDIIFGTTRPMLKRYALILSEYDGDICSTGYCVLRPDPKQVLSKFVFHLLGTEMFYAHVDANTRGAGYPMISNNAVKQFRIPIPSLEEQARLVAILDKFDALANDLSDGLPAEITARRQQYEYYRDRLLTIREAA